MASKNRLYPHLLPQDIAVWERYLNSPDAAYHSIEYDVRVGSGRDPGDTYEANIRQMAIDLSQRRIDAVGHRRDTIDIIEITTDAGLTAIGQLHAYPRLYTARYNPTKPLRTVLVCESIQTDLETAIRELGAHVYKV
jgi:hypothetical protein